MDKLRYFTIILFYFWLMKNERVKMYSRLKREDSNGNCTDLLEINNCIKNMKMVYRNQDFRIVSTLKWCEKKNYIFDYELINLRTDEVQKYHNNFGPILYVQKFTLDTGRYKVSLKVHVPKEKKILLADKCELSIKATPLFPKIKGGFQRYVRVGRDIFLDATDSMDYANENPVDPNNLQYYWLYNCNGCTDFSSARSSGPVVKLSGSQHGRESIYLVKLGIKSKWWTKMTYAYQVINVREEDPEIFILCKNCYSEYFDDGMEFEAKCISKCLTRQVFLWNLYIAPDDDITIISGTEKLQLQFSREGSEVLTLSLDDDIPPGKTYIMAVGFSEQNQTMAYYKFKNMKDYSLVCYLDPPGGIVLETEFQVNCEGEGFGSYFWVTINDHTTQKEIVLDYDSSWEYLSFTAPRIGVVNLRYSHYSGLEAEVNWDPDVKEDGFQLKDKKLNLDEIEDSYNKGNDSIDNSLDNFEYDKALDKMTLISRSLGNINVSADINKVEPTIDQLISDLRKIPMTSISNIQQASGIMEELTGVNTTFNPTLTKKMSALCRYLSEKYKDKSKKYFLEAKSDSDVSYTTVRFVCFLNLAKETDKFTASDILRYSFISSQLMKCSMGVNRPNVSAVQPKDPDVEVTTVDYILIEGETNTEVYDAYMDEGESSENKEQYKSVAIDFVEICFNNGNTLSRRINLLKKNNKDTEFVEADDYTITTMKKQASQFLKHNFESYGIKIKFPDDFVGNYEVYTIIICATSRNIFWWEQKIEIISNILVMFVLQDDQKLEQYNNNFEISFNVKSKPKDKFPSKNYSLNSMPSNGNNSNENKIQLPIYIVALEAGKSFCIEFSELQDNTTLNVVATDFELPTLNHFSGDPQTITQRENYFLDSLINEYEGFRLISILPIDSMKDEQLQFKMKAYAVSCVIWNPTERLWKNSCKAKFSKETENENIVCLCNHLSTITATMEEVTLKEWQDYIPLEISLEEQYFFVISIFMVSFYLLYCVILCFAVGEVDCTRKTVYFLGDIVSRSRFGYLIVTKTGNQSEAGTTSNVTIKIIGKKAESEANVLNYPDPLLKILQRGNEDWFFLATRFYLGKILEIELWYDGIGGLPSWYCSRVSIFDIQNAHWYEFRISSLFTIYPKAMVYVRQKTFNVSKDRTIKIKLIEVLENFKPDFRIFNLNLRYYRQMDESRSYIKRLTIMFSVVISIGLWCIILHGIPQRAPIDSIMTFCEYKLNWFIVVYGIGGSIITAIFHMPIIHIFMVSRVQFTHYSSFQKSKRSLIMTIICWLLVIILIIVHSTLIIFYGAWIPPVNAYIWVTAILIGLIFYIFVIETISSNILRFVRLGFNENENYVKRRIRKIMHDIETQRRVLYVMLGKYLLRPFLQHLYRPMKKGKITYRWIMEKMKYEVRELLENLVMFVVYTTLMYMVVLTNRDFQSVNSNKHIAQLIEGSHTKVFSLDSVVSISDLEKYIEKTLIGATQSKSWYKKFAVRDPGMTIDYTNKMLGVIRIRQHRSEANSCKFPELMQFINRSCNADYFKSQTFMDYGTRWSKLDPPPSEGRMKNVWRFTNSSETGTFPVLGKLGFYTGGGYVAFLGRGMKNSYVNLNYLQRYSWFDVLSRGIFIEFLLYNSNFNIFNAVRCIIEKSVTGYLKIVVKVETSRMLLVNQNRFNALNILLGLFVILVAVLSIKTLIRISRTGMWYFKDLWHLVDILLIALSYTCIILYYKRTKKVGTLLESLEGIDPRDFVNYFSLLRVDNAFTLTASLLVTVATIKLWLLFRFMTVFKVAEKTFSNSFVSLSALFTCHLILLISFSIFGYNLFVDHSYKFSDMFNSVELLAELNLQSFPTDELIILDRPSYGLGYIFYISYSLTVMTTNCVYSAMIIIYYSKAKEELSEFPQLYRVKTYLKNQFQFYYDLYKLRLKPSRLAGGGATNEDSSPVSPKSDEHRYADCFTLECDKLRAMSLVSLCAIKNSKPKRKPLSQRNIRLMTYTLYYLRKIKNEPDSDDEKERFYKGDLGGNKVKLIPEFNLTKIQAATSILLGQSRKKTMKNLNINTDDILKEDIKKQIQRMNKNLSIMVDILNKIKVEMG